ncbi:5543_t:CDS:2 [Gigaspora margarita]|uniref:5543_t:CDS:1 n=1 Tax=Gigaspora margarita TaxID=4874 RepID=A0ABN7WAX6_GIGMA|nr:5543_t:CDS:2 [Gigaspora margarita]
MYSVLLAGHDPKTPNNPNSKDSKKKHKYLRNKKLTQYNIYGLHSYDHQIYLERVNKIGLNPYDNKHWILLDGIQTLLYGYWQIGLYKHLIAFEISPKEAKERAMKARLSEKDLNNYIKTLAVKIFPKEEAYTKKLENYHKRYEDNDLYSSLEELYELYYQIAREKNHERSDKKVE